MDNCFLIDDQKVPFVFNDGVASFVKDFHRAMIQAVHSKQDIDQIDILKAQQLVLFESAKLQCAVDGKQREIAALNLLRKKLADTPS